MKNFLNPENNYLSTIIQPSLEIGSENDVYEQEANQVADKVMRMGEMKGSSSKLERMGSDEQEEKIQKMNATPSILPKMHPGDEENIVDIGSGSLGNSEKRIQMQTDGPPKITKNERQGDLTPDGKYVFLEGGDLDKREGEHGKWVDVPSGPEIEAGYAKVLRLIAGARIRGADQAANNLEWWLGGYGGIYNPTIEWLKSVPEFKDKAVINENRFFWKTNTKLLSLNIIAAGMRNGERATHEDYYIAQLRGESSIAEGDVVDKNTEFGFAYGGAELESVGSFDLVRKGEVVNVTGEVVHRFKDTYDWELGLSVMIGGESVTDEQMKLLEVYKGARPFQVDTSYTEIINRNIAVD